MKVVALLAVLWLLTAGSAFADRYVPYEHQVELERSRLTSELAKIPVKQRADYVRRQLDALTRPATSTPSADGKVPRPKRPSDQGQWAFHPDPRVVVLEEWLKNHKSPAKSPAARPEGSAAPPPGTWNYPIALFFLAAGMLLGMRRLLARDEPTVRTT